MRCTNVKDLKMSKISKYFGMVKFAHTVFALPFALIGYSLGVQQVGFHALTLLSIVLCMVFARNAAMGFNRLIDRRFDAENPRTSGREIPAGIINVRAAKNFVVINSILFMAAASVFNVDGKWNPWPLVLSPLVLLIVLGYSYTKRFTALCHLVLGLGLAIAPTGAYLAVTGEITLLPLLFSVLVLSWVSGFDIIYALQDADFDTQHGLRSIPQLVGVGNALIISALIHVISLCTVVVIGIILDSGYLYWAGAVVFISLLIYQHTIVTTGNLSRVGVAFGTTNGVASVLYACFVILSLFFAS